MLFSRLHSAVTDGIYLERLITDLTERVATVGKDTDRFKTLSAQLDAMLKAMDRGERVDYQRYLRLEAELEHTSTISIMKSAVKKRMKAPIPTWSLTMKTP